MKRFEIRMLAPLIVMTAASLGTPAHGPDTTAPVLALVASADRKCRLLAGRLDACRRAGQDVAVPDAALAVAELFCRYSRYDAGHDDLRPAALRSMRYVDAMLDGELRKAGEVLAGRSGYPAVPQWRTARFTWHDGGFWSGGRPVFLTGLNWDAGMAVQDPALLRRLGINLTDGVLRGSTKPDGSFDDASFKAGDGRYLERMDRAGFPVDCLLIPDLPAGMAEAAPGLASRGYGNGYDYDIEHPLAARYRARFLDHFVPLYAAHPSFFAVDLANEPAFQGLSDLTIEGWRAWLRRKYGTVSRLNRAWGASLASFDDVRRFPSVPETMTGPWDRAAVPFDRPGIRGMLYDACAYNNERISRYFGALSDRIHARAPHAAAHVKVMLGLYFTGSTEARGWRMDLSYHTFGIDPEALARSCDLLGGDVDLIDLSHVAKLNRRYGSAPYALGWLDAGLAADFLTSLAPGKPFYDSEFHVTEDNHPATDPTGSRAHIIAALWLAHLHGMRANLLWYWGRDPDGAPSGQGAGWFTGSVLQQPWMLQGYAQESLRLRRFVRPIMAFARGPRSVRLLYSEASAVQDVRYLDALRDSYEALNFLGVPIGFVTERQIEEDGVPAGTRLLIVPNARYVQDTTMAALEAARRRGVAVEVIGDRSLTETPTGRPREAARIPVASRIPAGSPQDYIAPFNNWIRQAGIRRDLLALDARGRTAWGIETRTTRGEGHRLAYMVNLTRRPVRVRLRWRAAHARLRDWRTGSRMPDDLTLAPRQVVFGSY